MPSMNIHRSDLETTKVTSGFGAGNEVHWLQFQEVGYGDYLTVYLDCEEYSLRFLVELEKEINNVLARLVNQRMEVSE